MRDYLRKGYDLSSQDKMGMPALVFASVLGSIEIVDILIACGANVNVKNKLGQTALMIASKNGYLDIIDLLHINGADIDERDSNGSTAIMYAIADTQLDVVKSLISKNANLEIQDKDGRSALLFALHSLEPVELESLNILEKDLAKAREANDVELEKINELKLKREKRKIELNEKILAITKGITEKGVNLNLQDDEQKTACMYAIEKKQINIVEDFISKGVDLTIKDKSGMTAIDKAKNCGISSLSQLVNISNSQSIDIGDPLAGNAGLDIDPSTTDISNRTFGDPNKRNEKNQTPLMIASYNGDAKLVNDLIFQGADVNLKDSKGYTALMFASSKGNVEVIELLMRQRVFLDQKTVDGYTALYLAIIANHASVSKILYERGARTSINYDGKNLLSLAAMYGAVDSVRFLVKKGMNPYTKDVSGKTAMDYAVQYKRKKVMLLLKQLGKHSKE
ncbi:MAG: ankyrin repeat domain-containing protein [Oligoflexia bacterium]|nr:ankyrin repeat domain-containing protein [Oligoflexia bacterium]